MTGHRNPSAAALVCGRGTTVISISNVYLWLQVGERISFRMCLARSVERVVIVVYVFTKHGLPALLFPCETSTVLLVLCYERGAILRTEPVHMYMLPRGAHSHHCAGESKYSVCRALANGATCVARRIAAAAYEKTYSDAEAQKTKQEGAPTHSYGHKSEKKKKKARIWHTTNESSARTHALHMTPSMRPISANPRLGFFLSNAGRCFCAKKMYAVVGRLGRRTLAPLSPGAAPPPLPALLLPLVPLAVPLPFLPPGRCPWRTVSLRTFSVYLWRNVRVSRWDFTCQCQ